MTNYKNLNNIAGWLIFVIATIVYALTVEPTASFWDCGEYIACAYKLQIPHPPGAPLFLLLGRMFSFLSMGDVESVAHAVNMLSVVSSSFTILFLFWTITFLARKLVTAKHEEPAGNKKILILGSAIVGSLAYTFTDSFWFSAAEAEVYALSSFFTAFVFWAMLKWEARADEPQADRWLLLVAFMVGLSIGVHLLNLVAIPALAFIYYFRKYTVSRNGIIATFLIGMAVLFLINWGIIQGLPTFAGEFELFFVNSLGLPFGSGVLFFIALIIAIIVYGIYYSHVRQMKLLNTAMLCLAFIMIGYASYGIIPIRSASDPPIDENDPENVLSFISYLKREQYGQRPLVYGAQFTAEVKDQKKGDPMYMKGDDQYKVYAHDQEYIWDQEHETLFPRMYSKQGRHKGAYKRWVDIDEGQKPGMGQNLGYFFEYQVGHMYLRYFLWNFVGRQNDKQGHGGPFKGNWVSGIKPLDEWHLGISLDNVPESIKENKARNFFYLLPLLLGIMGFVFQMNNSKKDFSITFMLFFFTGLAIILYLNQPPQEPRERDYTYAGSFYAFSIWIGLGVLGISSYLRNTIKKDKLRSLVAIVMSLVVPGVLVADGWNDHDRSGRYYSVDSAKNLLNTCDKNAILFTGGDNDTFPLWYAQEVEGFRTDVRVCNLSLLNTDWYIKRMKKDAYKSAPLPISLEYEDFIKGVNDYIPYNKQSKAKNRYIHLPGYINLVKNESPKVMARTNISKVATLPSKKFMLPIDSAKVASMDFVPESKKKLVQNNIRWNIKTNGLDKKSLIILDILANNNWERPVYFSTTLGSSGYLNLQDYLQLEGLAYRLMPFKADENSQGGDGYVNTDIMYERMMNNYYWRNMDDSTVYYNQDYRRLPYNIRNSFYRLGKSLQREGKDQKAGEVIKFSMEKMPDYVFPHRIYASQYIDILMGTGNEERAMQLTADVYDRIKDELDYFAGLSKIDTRKVRTNLFSLNRIVSTLKDHDKTDKAKTYEEYLNKRMDRFGNQLRR